MLTAVKDNLQPLASSQEVQDERLGSERPQRGSTWSRKRLRRRLGGKSRAASLPRSPAESKMAAGAKSCSFASSVHSSVLGHFNAPFCFQFSFGDVFVLWVNVGRFSLQERLLFLCVCVMCTVFMPRGIQTSRWIVSQCVSERPAASERASELLGRTQSATDTRTAGPSDETLSGPLEGAARGHGVCLFKTVNAEHFCLLSAVKSTMCFFFVLYYSPGVHFIRYPCESSWNPI